MRRASLLWALTALFVLRVLGQVLVAFFDVQWLPPMERWYSGLIPYPALLGSQLLIIGLMVTICTQFTRRSGWFYEPRRLLGPAVLVWDRPIPIWHRR